MSYFVDAENRDPMTLVPGARTRTFGGENILLSLVEIDANSEVPTHTHTHEQRACWLRESWRWESLAKLSSSSPARCTSFPVPWSTTQNAAMSRPWRWTSSARSAKSSSISHRTLFAPAGAVRPMSSRSQEPDQRPWHNLTVDWQRTYDLR